MPIDPRIALGFQAPQMPDFGELASRRLQTANVMMQMRDRERELDQQNRLAAALQSVNPNNPSSFMDLARIPGGAAIAAQLSNIQQNIAQGERAEETLGIQRSQNVRAEQNFAQDQLGSSLISLYNDPSDENIEFNFKRLKGIPGLDLDDYRDKFAKTPKIEDRQRFIGQYLNQTEEGRQFLDQYTSKPEEMDLGDRIVVVERNPKLPNFNKQIAAYAKGVPPDVAYRAGVEAEKTRKPSGVEGITSVINNMRSTIEELSKKGAMIDTSRFGTTGGVLKNLQAAARATPAGQAVERAAGTPESALRDTFLADRTRLVQAIKTALSMSAQELNSNVELKTWLDSVGSPGMSRQTNETILKNIEDYVNSRLKDQGRAPMTEGGESGGGNIPPLTDSAKKAGVDLKVWGAMTPEGRKLFQ